jgi:transcriptional regulator with XRE-family HTH domain
MLSTRLASLRKAAGLTQTELAQRAGLSLGWVHKIERGERKGPLFATMVKLARALNVSLAEFALADDDAT